MRSRRPQQDLAGLRGGWCSTRCWAWHVWRRRWGGATLGRRVTGNSRLLVQPLQLLGREVETEQSIDRSV